MDQDHILVRKERQIPGTVVSHNQTSSELAVDLLFSQEINEEIHGYVWGVSEGPCPCRGRYAQEHTVQHKPTKDVVILPRFHRPK